MSTLTTPSAPSVTSAPSATATSGGAAAQDGQKRVLQISPPPGKREKVVQEAAAALATTYADDVNKAEDTIKEFGLTIEVSRLRDRLARSVASDLQRLLLSTAGVPEFLFNKAIKQQLEEEQKAGSQVQDTSVKSIGSQIEAASRTLQESLSAINASTQKFQESTAKIVSSLEKVAVAIDELEDGDDQKPTGPEPKPKTHTSARAKQTEESTS